MLASRVRVAARSAQLLRRSVSSLATNSHIKVFEQPGTPKSYLLTFLETEPPNSSIAIGTSATNPPSPQSFQENPRFVSILNEVVTQYGHQDEDVTSQARALASPGGHNLGVGGMFAPRNRRTAKRQGASGSEAGGASGQGGAGGGGRGGWVHLSDRRNPPDFGRIAWPEDILASVEVDDAGGVVGNAQPSGTYRVLTNEGILGLSPFLRRKLVERLRQEEGEVRNS